MVKVLLCVICFVLSVQTVKAEGRVCLAAGEVNLEVSPLIETVTGSIGATEVSLIHWQNKIIGTFQGMDVNLKVYGWRAYGYIGKNKVSWGYAKGHIHGFERCLF